MEVRPALLIAFLCFVHGSASAPRCSNTRPCQLKTNKLLRHPDQLISKNQHLEVTLKVQMAEVTVGGWLKLWRRTYNGDIGGPTLRVKPGDTIVVNLVNTLEPNGKDSPHNTLRLANSTNLYLHGLHVSPQSNDPTLRANPGEMRRYVYKIDCKHPAGTYWYHPHLHGSSMFQTLSGMAGLIVVEDISAKEEIPGSISSVSCPYHCEHEVHLMFQPTVLYKSGNGELSFADIQRQIRDDPRFRSEGRTVYGITLGQWLKLPFNNIQQFTTNGQLQPLIRIRAGEMKRFRMVNAGGIHVLEIDVPKSNSGQACDVYEIARDGIYLPRPKKPNLGQSIIAQGGVVEWLIRCDSPGVYEIASNPTSKYDSSLGASERLKVKLASIEVVSVAPKYRKSSLSFKSVDTLPIDLPSHPKYIPDLKDVHEKEIKGRFVVETASNNILNREKYPSPSEFHIRHKMLVDGVQEWTLLNADSVNSHTLHIPGNHFQVVSYNKYRGPIAIEDGEDQMKLTDQVGRLCDGSARKRLVPKRVSVKKIGLYSKNYEIYTGNGFAEIGEWRNTILMPRLSNITVRFVPRHFAGRIFVHSHNLQRADFGMMMITAVVEKGQSTHDVIVAVKGALPGTCHPGEFYPTVSSPIVSVASNTLNDFFLWLYKFQPAYVERYGDQRYLTGLYGAYLKETGYQFSTGSHLRDFFRWTYDKFPAYEAHYGDQSYLYELYNYYITNEVAVHSVKKLN